VVRNRIKRLARESVRYYLPLMKTGWDVLLIARQAARRARFAEVNDAVHDLLERAELQIDPSLGGSLAAADGGKA